jgi:hypothetical protein
MAALPEGWTWRNDPSKTYRIALPPFFAFVSPKDSGVDPSFSAKFGVKGSYWDTRHLHDKYMTAITIQDLPYAKAVAINSPSDLLSWAQSDIAVNGSPGAVIQSTTVATVHLGYAVSITTTAPESTQTGGLVLHVFDVYYASPEGIWVVDVAAPGDAAWSDLSAMLPLLPAYFEAPPES